MRHNLKIVERKNFGTLNRLFLQYFFSEYLNNVILLLKKNRIYNFDPKNYSGLNVGCSTSNPPNWIGLSGGIIILFLRLPKFLQFIGYLFTSRAKKESFNSFHSKIKSIKIIHHNLFYGIPFKDDTVPYIYSSHFFEHLTYNTADYLFKECFRVLKDGGKIRIVVPSLDNSAILVEAALNEYKNSNPIKLITLITEEYSSYIDSFSHHRYMYNFELLKNLLLNIGFKEVKQYNRNEGSFPDLNRLEFRDGIFIEAEKF